MTTGTVTAAGELSFGRTADSALVIRLAGAWKLDARRPSADAVRQEIEASLPPAVQFDASELADWDSGVLTFLIQVMEICRQHQISVDRSALPGGVQQLLRLAEAVPEKKDARAREEELPFVEQVGTTAISAGSELGEMLAFLGEASLALRNFVQGRARFRRRDLFLLIQQAGAEALPIVTLVSFLLGLILAFVGAVQLQVFGAQIYVANLVGVAMVRDMGALMTGIIMAGRSGAAYAAQLGSMQVTQETDALATMGISPMEFLVVPRIVALSLMMPLLTLYSDLLGILGGAAVGIGMLDLSITTYFTQTFDAVRVIDLLGGFFKAGVYGVLVALAGCLRGMQSGKSSSAVGDAATSAVVTAIVAIIAACGLFAWLFYMLGI